MNYSLIYIKLHYKMMVRITVKITKYNFACVINNFLSANIVYGNIINICIFYVYNTLQYFLIFIIKD